MNFGVTEVPKAKDLVLKGFDLSKPIDVLIRAAKFSNRWNAVRALEKIKASREDEKFLDSIPNPE